MRTLLTTALLLALAAAVPIASSQAPEPIACGATITTDTKLDRDLLDCPSNGLIIGADGVELDLNGHVVDGDGSEYAACGEEEPCDIGVLVDGHTGVTISGGAVREFATGVIFLRARDDRVVGVDSSANTFFGFVIAGSSRIVVRNSSGSANPAPDGDGLGVFDSHHLRVTGSTFRGNGQLGIHVEDSHHLLIEDNLFARNHDMALLMEKAGRNRLIGNRCVHNGACVIVAPGNGNVIARNRSLGDGDGIAIEKGSHNLVRGNVVLRPGNVGIRLGLVDPPIGGADNAARGNRVRRSGRDGYVVSAHDHGSVLAGNEAVASADDGFDVASGSASLARNRALGNRDLGIEAAAGVTDGGGNVARGNGDPRGCTNIAC